MKRLAILFVTLLLIQLHSYGQSSRLPLSTSYWKSQSFLKEFNGSYRINANIEPILSTPERGLLVEMQDLMAKGQRDQAITKLKASSSLKNSAAIQFNLANVLSEVGKLEDAITYYQRASTTLPAFRRAHQNIAFAYYRNDQIDKANEHLLEAVRLGANNGSVHGLLGYCFIQKGNYEPALRSFREALITQPTEKDWKIGIAQALENLNRTPEALTLYQQLHKNHPEDNGITLQLALIHNELDQVKQATTLLELLRRRNALDEAYQLLLGTLLIGDRNTRVGAETLRTVLKNESFKTPDLALQSIQYCFSEGFTDLALELHSLIKVQNLSKTGLTTHTRLKAQIILSETPNAPEAISLLEKLIAENPLDSHSLTLLAKQRVLSDRKHEALLLFDQAIHADGSHSPAAQLEKAQTLVQLQRYKDAATTLKSYLETQPEDSQVIEYLAQLEKLVAARHTTRTQRK